MEGGRERTREIAMERTQQDLVSFKDGRMWPQAKECGWPLESGISKRMYSLLEPPKGTQDPFWTPDLENHKIIKLC